MIGKTLPATAATVVAALCPSLALALAPPPAASPAASQSTSEQEVVAAVQALFDAMAARDRGVLEDLLMPEGRIVAMRGGETAGTPGSTSQAEFVEAISAAEGRLLERMWEPQVLVDGAVAMLWAPYDFHHDGVFSHCGVDHFSLVRTAAGWKVAGITYTVQRDGCTPSPLGPPR